MPMIKSSTLIYLVNSFQVDMESTLFKFIQKNEECSITKMESLPLPSESTIESVLNFARSYDVLETKETGYVEMNLN